MSDVQAKRDLLLRSKKSAVHFDRAQIGDIAHHIPQIEALQARISKAADASEIAQLRAELQELESTLMAHLEALAQRLDDELEPRVWKFKVERDNQDRISGLVAKPEA